MKNTVQLIEVIKSVDGMFSTSEKLVYIELIKLAINNKAIVTVHFLKDATSLSNTAIYTALRSLQLKGCIHRIAKDTFNILPKGIQYITELFEMQDKYRNKEDSM